jgi:hypothetical protein
MQENARNGFKFYTSSLLAKPTYLIAQNLKQFQMSLERVGSSSIFYHTYYSFRNRSPINNLIYNDLAYWIYFVLGDVELGQRLARLPIFSYPTLRSLRETFLECIEEYLRGPSPTYCSLPDNSGFHFCEAVSVEIPIGKTAQNISDFVKVLESLSARSFFHHFYSARIRNNKRSDFYVWLHEELDATEVAEEIDKLVSYSEGPLEVKEKVLNILKKRFKDVL